MDLNMNLKYDVKIGNLNIPVKIFNKNAIARRTSVIYFIKRVFSIKYGKVTFYLNVINISALDILAQRI